MEGLNYNLKKNPKCVINIDIELPWKDVEPQYDEIFQQIRQSVRIPGFRKGHVPINIVRERYTQEAKQELVSKLTPKILNEVLEKEKVNPVTTPKITDYKFEEEKPFKLSVKVEVYPEIQLKKYHKIKLEKKEQIVLEDDVNKTIEAFRTNNAVLKQKDGVIVEGDFALVEFKVFVDSNEVKLDMPQETLIEVGQDHILSGFSKNILGLTKGENKEFDYKFADDFRKDELKGKDGRFILQVKDVKEKELPDEKEVAESLGFESVEKLREHIKTTLQQQMDKASDDEIERQIINYLTSKHTFELPDGLVGEEVEKKKKQMAEYIKKQGGAPEKIQDEKIRESVIREIKAGLLLSKIADEENIKISEDDRKEEVKRIIKMFGKDDEKTREQAKQYVNDNLILTKKVFNMIKDNAKIKIIKGNINGD